jgi:hypothetical protein
MIRDVDDDAMNSEPAFSIGRQPLVVVNNRR